MKTNLKIVYAIFFITQILILNIYGQTLTDHIITLKQLGASDELISSTVYAHKNNTMKISEVIKLKEAGIADELIINIINKKQNTIFISPKIDSMINELKNNGIQVDVTEIKNMKDVGITEDTILLFLKKKYEIKPVKKSSVTNNSKNDTPPTSSSFNLSENNYKSEEKEFKDFDNVWGLKTSIGKSPMWSAGFNFHAYNGGIEVLFSNCDAAGIKKSWEDRYGSDLEVSTLMFEISLFLLSRPFYKLDPGDICYQYGLGYLYSSVDINFGDIAFFNDVESSGEVSSFDLFVGLHHKLTKQILLEYRIGYRLFKSLKLKSDLYDSNSNQWYEYETELDGSEMNGFLIQVGLSYQLPN